MCEVCRRLVVCTVVSDVWLCFPVFLFQKAAQLDEEQATSLHDIVCLWVWLRSHMEHEFNKTVVEQHDVLFMKGCLASNMWGRAGLASTQSQKIVWSWLAPTVLKKMWLVFQKTRHISRIRVGWRQTESQQSQSLVSSATATLNSDWFSRKPVTILLKIGGINHYIHYLQSNLNVIENSTTYDLMIGFPENPSHSIASSGVLQCDWFT